MTFWNCAAAIWSLKRSFGSFNEIKNGILFYSNLAVEEVSNYQLLLGHSHFDYVESYLLGSQIEIKKESSRNLSVSGLLKFFLAWKWSNIRNIIFLMSFEQDSSKTRCMNFVGIDLVQVYLMPVGTDKICVADLCRIFA